MTRRRRRKSTPRNVFFWLLVFLALLVISELVRLIEEHPWVAAILGVLAALLVVLAGAAVYWRGWVRPRRRAAAERAFIEQAGRAEHERVETARQDLRERSLTLGGLLALTARELEVRVGEILGEHGYSGIEHVGRAGDLGIDLFATDPSGERVGIQCKRYAPDKLVRAPEVRLLYGDMAHANVRGLFVTTSGYTADAKAYAELHGIVLIDGARLAKLVAATRTS